MAVFLFVIILLILIISHEFGHFIVAKMMGVRVDEFGLGFPPRIAAVRKGETEYSLNWLPFGGFVRIYGEDGEDIVPSGADRARSFSHKPALVQAAIIAAGVGFNLLLAWLLVSVGFASGLPTPVAAAPAGAELADVRLLITGVAEDSPAARAGLQGGDELLYLATADEAAQGDPLESARVQDFIARHGAEEFAIGYRRGEETKTARVTPETGVFGDKPAIGISMDLIGIAELPLPRAVWEGLKATGVLFTATAKGLWLFFTGLFTGQSSFSDIAGPVGIVGIVGEAQKVGFIYLIGLTAIISINLAVINLVPFPALDGGRLLFIAIEKLKGSPLSPRIMNAANTGGFVLLIALMVAITYFDILRLS